MQTAEQTRALIELAMTRFIEAEAAAQNFDGALDALALDKESVRTIDTDGHMHVSRTPISKANICEYWGNEIPNWEALGLQGDRTYKLYRDPEELAKGASTFARKPILIRHTPISSDEHPSDLTVGTIGDDVEFAAPFLMAPLTIWDQKGIDLIESGKQKELSCGYRYTPVMVSGTTDSGESFDGRMTNIVANHLALVEEGRAGPDVVVGDSALSEQIPETEPENTAMVKTLSRKALVAHGALSAYLAPKLAKDAKINVALALDGVTAKNFDAKIPAIVESVKKLTAGKLAKDAKLDDITIALDAMKDVEAEDGEMPGQAALDADEPDDKKSKMKAFLKDKLSEDDMKACDAMMDDDQEAMDEKDDKGAEDEEKDDKGAEDEEKDEKVDKKAMDAAIRATARETEKRVVARMRDLRLAENEVLPYVGKLAIACDSATEVYKHALDAMKIDVSDVHPSAFRAILRSQPKPADKQEKRDAERSVVAMDAASVASFTKMFPKAGPVKRV